MSICYEFISRETGNRISVAEADDILCALYGFEPDPDTTHPVLFHVVMNIDSVRCGGPGHTSVLTPMQQKYLRMVDKMFVVNVWRGR